MGDLARPGRPPFRQILCKTGRQRISPLYFPSDILTPEPRCNLPFVDLLRASKVTLISFGNSLFGEACESNGIDLIDTLIDHHDAR